MSSPGTSPATPDVPTTTFADGSSIPLIGFGTGGAHGSPGADRIASALRAGYRLLDTAAQYNNETAVGEGPSSPLPCRAPGPVALHREHGIVTQAWGPLGTREGLSEQFAIQRVAAKHEVTVAQVALRWAVDQEIVVIPRSANPERQRLNLDLGGIHLDDEDRALLASVDLGEERAWDSREHEEW